MRNARPRHVEQLLRHAVPGDGRGGVGRAAPPPGTMRAHDGRGPQRVEGQQCAVINNAREHHAEHIVKAGLRLELREPFRRGARARLGAIQLRQLDAPGVAVVAEVADGVALLGEARDLGHGAAVRPPHSLEVVLEDVARVADEDGQRLDGHVQPAARRDAHPRVRPRAVGAGQRHAPEAPPAINPSIEDLQQQRRVVQRVAQERAQEGGHGAWRCPSSSPSPSLGLSLSLSLGLSPPRPRGAPSATCFHHPPKNQTPNPNPIRWPPGVRPRALEANPRPKARPNPRPE
mmetsp:Transcript_31120/g.98772  ORF Transcript_31120/g.98772 Transcript_31120/m.98772 type:complete len:289 (+) Transcript_31120:1166-2032(+)